ncbi:MAG: YegS/Rv2252/BmrU family lipid kinase [Firmicutes bacterium]|nr:YegS/Rv2252/BmrU family lipid kinase [Bacillota bacterium]
MEKVKSRKVLLIYNPASGNGLFKSKLDEIIMLFQKIGLFVTPVRADRRYLIEEIFQHITEDEFRKVIVAGGDGTILVVVNAMLNAGKNLPLAVFPAGTANDFAYYFDIPTRIEDMVNVACGEHYTTIDLGMANDKYFINVAAMGFMVDVSQKTDPELKNTLGQLAYYLRGAEEVTKIRPLTVRLTSEEYTGEEKMYFMVVMNGRSAGGFKQVGGSSRIDDGLLDVILFREMNILEFPTLLLSILQGNHVENKHVLNFKTKRVLIESDDDFGTDVDGEHCPRLPLEIKVLPGKLKVATWADGTEPPRW